MRVIDMADIIRAMQNETQFVLRCEEVFHDRNQLRRRVHFIGAAAKALRLPHGSLRLGQDDDRHAPEGLS